MDGFGARLKAARKMAGMSQQKLADATDNLITKQAVSKYEKGKMMPASDILIAISKALYDKIAREVQGEWFNETTRITQKVGSESKEKKEKIFKNEIEEARKNTQKNLVDRVTQGIREGEFFDNFVEEFASHLRTMGISARPLQENSLDDFI